MKRTKRRRVGRSVIGVALALTATLGIGAAALLDRDTDLNAYYRKVETNSASAFKEDLIVLPIAPEETVSDPDLKESLHERMTQVYKGEVNCVLGPGDYRRLGPAKDGVLILIEYKAVDKQRCSGYFEVIPEFWALIYTVAQR